MAAIYYFCAILCCLTISVTADESIGKAPLQGLVFDNSTDESIVTTPLGPVQGLVFDNGRLFSGVRYGEQPTRFRAAETAKPWGPSVYDGTLDPPGCYQYCLGNEPPHICPTKLSEDCLFLNVWTPRLPQPNSVSPTAAPSWPVVVFIHGGNFFNGYAGGVEKDGGILYDGRTWTNTSEIVVVVIQYRMGAFGFLYLGDESETKVNGNFGLQDQILAVEWVAANIASFGGEPTRMTLMGQSAGAMSISCHMSRPQTNGLYQGAIMMSNPFGESYRDTESAKTVASAFLNFTGCGVLTNATIAENCLNTLDADAILAAQVLAQTDILANLDRILQIIVPFPPTINTPYLPQRPLESFQSGNVIDIPYLVGTTSNETVIFVYEVFETSPGQYLPLSEIEYDVVAALLVGLDLALEIPTYYPTPSPPPTDFKVFASYLTTDGLFDCPTRNASEALQVSQPFRKSKAYHWQYSHVAASSPNFWNTNFTECYNMACHGSDLVMIWHPVQPLIANFTDEENVLALQMQHYFGSFIATGNPGDAGTGLAWPAYDAVTRQTLNFETASMGGVAVIESLHGKECAWWDEKVGYLIY
jgi:carboxylesterase type B